MERIEITEEMLDAGRRAFFIGDYDRADGLEYLDDIKDMIKDVIEGALLAYRA